MDGSDGAIREARRLAREDPELYFYADQYNNEANCLAHYEGTGPEIVAQTEGRLTHFVAGLGTSGTFVGVGRYLRERLPDVKLISVQPDSPLHGIEGLKHMPTAIVPGIYDPTIADIDLEARTEESQAMTRRLARNEGLLVGVSTGAAVAAALRVAKDLERAVFVVLSPDGGEKYLSDPFWTAE
jgi:cysteine synthase B